MPKILVKEKEINKLGSAVYENNAVVIPGYVKARELVTINNVKYALYGGKTPYKTDDLAQDLGKNVFDENGVFECDNIQDFENCIGKVGVVSIPKDAVPAEFKTALVKGDVPVAGAHYYTRVKDDTAVPGYLVDAQKYVYTFAFISDGIGAITESEAGKYHEIVKAGSNKIVTNNHLGNQMAYKALELGYTVLFVKMDSTKTEAQLDEADFWAALKDKSVYDFRYICTGGYCSDNAYSEIAKVAAYLNNETLQEKVDLDNVNGRGDCAALIDIDEAIIPVKDQKTAVEKIKAKLNNDANIDYLKKEYAKYCAIVAPKVTYTAASFGEDEEYSKNRVMPATFHFLACAAYARSKGYPEYWAVAGYDQGISKYIVEKTSIKFGDIGVNALQPRVCEYKNFAYTTIKHAVNVIAYVRGNYYIWGNRTAKLIDENDLKYSHFLNIRNLCTTIKKNVYNNCKKYSYNPNSDVLWANFTTAHKDMFEKMKANEGLENYAWVKKQTALKGALIAGLRIKPIEAVEDFEINMSIENSISGIEVDFDEYEEE